jgi:hypothetical protein
MRIATGAALGCLTILLFSSAALAAPPDDLSPLTNRQYVDYARDRFEWLTGYVRSGQRVIVKFKPQCRPDAAPDSDAARACEITKAAEQQQREVLEEADALMRGLQQRFGTVPRWARRADAQLIAAGR